MTSIRIAHISDTHIEDSARLDELITVLNVFTGEARRLKVDVILHTGDVFDRKSAAVERNAFADWLRAAGEIAPVVTVKGNHDAVDDLTIFSRIRTTNPIFVAERPEVVSLRTADVLCLPWFSKSHLVAQLPPTLSAEETSLRTLAVARDLLTVQRACAAESRAKGRIPVLAAHILVSGSEVSSGQTLQGCTVGLNPYDLHEVGAAYVALGHVHKRQQWFDGRISYAGSPIRQDFGEPETKGFNLIEIDETVHNEFIELPARRIERFEADFSGGKCPVDVDQWIRSQEWNVRDSWARFRYRIDRSDAHRVDDVAIKRLLLGAGAYQVQIEAIKEEQMKIRCEEIVTAETDWDKVQAFWRAKGFDLSSEQLQRLELEFAALEQEEAVSAA